LPLLIITNCNDSSTDPEVFFNYDSRITGSIDLLEGAAIVKVSNAIGFINVTGSSNNNEVSFVLDKTVKVKDSSEINTAFDKINISHSFINDTLIINIDSPLNSDDLFKCSLNINVPYNMMIEITKANKGSYVSYLDSDVKIETENYETTILNLYGSLYINSKDGNISATLSIPFGGKCNIVSESGDVNVKIPSNSNVQITLKTVVGIINYSALNLNVTSSSATQVIGTLNTGDSEIYLSSDKGKITLEGLE
jgi:hypothetical protein